MSVNIYKLKYEHLSCDIGGRDDAAWLTEYADSGGAGMDTVHVYKEEIDKVIERARKAESKAKQDNEDYLHLDCDSIDLEEHIEITNRMEKELPKLFNETEGYVDLAIDW